MGANDTEGDTDGNAERSRDKRERDRLKKKNDVHRSVADRKAHRDSSSHLFIQQTVSAQQASGSVLGMGKTENVTSFPPGAYVLAQGNRQEASI